MKVDDHMQEEYERRTFLDSYNERMQKVISLENEDMDLAIKELEELLSLYENEYSDKNIHTFDKVIDSLLYIRSHKEYTRENTLPLSVHKTYFRLALDLESENRNDDALEALLKAHEINPYSEIISFEIAKVYNKLNDLESMREFILSCHKYLYKKESLAMFYSHLGDYAFAIRDYDAANKLYSYSEKFNNMGRNEKKLSEIAKMEYRMSKLSPEKEILEYLHEQNIPTNISNAMLQELLNIYRVPVKNDEGFALNKEVKAYIYGLTNDERFSPSSIVKNDKIGVSFKIPEVWNVITNLNINKKYATENTVMIVRVDDNTTFDISNYGQVNDIKFRYNEIKNKYINEGFFIGVENIVKINGREYIQSFVVKKILTDVAVTVHYFSKINGNMIDFNIPVLTNKVTKEDLMKDKNVQRMIMVLSSLSEYEMKNDEEEEFTFF